MSEKPSRTLYPEVRARAEHLSQPDTIDEIRAERVTAEADVEAALELIRGLGADADQRDVDTAYENLQETRGRLGAFNEMWTNFGGDKLDAAEAAVDAAEAASRGAKDTRVLRAQAELGGAEDAFYYNMRDASDAMLDDAHVMNAIEDEKRSVTLGEIEDAESEAHEERVERNGTRVVDVEAARSEANLVREAELEAAGTRVTDIDAARAEAKLEQEARIDAAGTRVVDFEDALAQANAERERMVNAAGTRILDPEAARLEADLVREQQMNAAGTRVTDIDAARAEAVEESKSHVTPEEYEAAFDEAIIEDQQYEHDNRWHRRAYRRLNVAFTNTVERFKRQDRKTKVGVVLGAVAVVGLAIWAAKSGMSHDGLTPDVTPNSGPTNPGANPGDHVSSAEHFTPSARQASRNEGWDQQLTQMGIPKSEQAGVKEQLLNSKDPNLKGWVYRMDDGQPGIARTGKFSQSMLESIKNLRNR